MNFRIFENPIELARGVAEAIVRRVEHDAARVIALSGGSTPRPIYEMLAGDEMRPTLAKYPIVWVVGDERFVDAGHRDSNQRMIRESLFRHGMAEQHRFVVFDTGKKDAAESAAAFEELWREESIPRVDLAVLGIGDDGHTASLFPGTEVLQEENRVASEVFVPKLNVWRLTLTLPMLREAGARFVVAAGDGKREVLRKIKAGEDFPIATVTRGTHDTWWFVDRAAYPSSEAEG